MIIFYRNLHLSRILPSDFVNNLVKKKNIYVYIAHDNSKKSVEMKYMT